MNYEGPIWHWVVRFVYRASRYFDSPLYRCRQSICFWTKEEADAFIANPGPDLARNILAVCFWTYAEARAWADAPHSELLDFKVESIYEEAIPQLLVHPCVPCNSHYYSPENTDDMIINHI